MKRAIAKRRLKLAREIVDLIFADKYGAFESSMGKWFSYKLTLEAVEQILKRHKV